MANLLLLTSYVNSSLPSKIKSGTGPLSSAAPAVPSIYIEDVDNNDEHDTIDGERDELDAVDQLQEEANRQQSEDECADETDDEERQGVHREVFPVLHEREEACTCHDRHRHDECEVRCRTVVHAEQHAAGDRRA